MFFNNLLGLFTKILSKLLFWTGRLDNSIAFAKMQKEFDALNTQLVGLSVDSLSSHIAWVRNIKEKIEWEGEKLGARD